MIDEKVHEKQQLKTENILLIYYQGIYTFRAEAHRGPKTRDGRGQYA